MTLSQQIAKVFNAALDNRGVRPMTVRFEPVDTKYPQVRMVTGDAIAVVKSFELEAGEPVPSPTAYSAWLEEFAARFAANVASRNLNAT